MNELAGAMRRHRHLLEVLVYKLTVTQRLLEANDDRYFAWAAEEVRQATDKLRVAEVERALASHHSAADAGLRVASPTLRDLIAASSEPYRTMLEDDRQALLGLQHELEELRATSRRIALHGHASIESSLDAADRRRALENLR